MTDRGVVIDNLITMFAFCKQDHDKNIDHVLEYR